MSFDDLVRQDRRHSILSILSSDPDYSHNDRVIQTALCQLGHSASGDLVRGDLDWLAEQGLVRLEDVGGLKVATLTERGGDVAAGTATVSGVKHPRPRR